MNAKLLALVCTVVMAPALAREASLTSSSDKALPITRPALSPTLVQDPVWNSIPEFLKANRYVPPSKQHVLSDDQKRRRIADFYAVLDARDRVLAGTATSSERSMYFSALRRDLELRRQVYMFLGTKYRKSSPLRKLVDTKVAESQSRLRLLSRSLAPTRAGTNGVQAIAREVAKNRVLCVQDRYNLLVCLSERTVLVTDMRGRWIRGAEWTTDVYDEGRAFDVLQRLNDLIAKTGQDSSKDTTLICSLGAVLAFDSSRSVSSSGQRPPPPQATGGLPTFADMRGMASACNYLNGFGGPGGAASVGGGVPGSGSGLGGTNGSWVNDQVTAIDQEVGSCIDSGSGGLEEDLTLQKFIENYIGLPASKPGFLGFLRTAAFWDALSLPNDMGEKYNEELKQANEIRASEVAAVDAESAAATAEYDAVVARAAADEAAKTAQEAAEVADADPTSAEKAEAAAKAKKDADDAAAAAKKAEDEAAQKAAEAEKKRKEAEEKKKAAGATGTQGGTHSSIDPGTGSACSGLQSWWTSFKAECDRNQGWDKAGSPCNDLLRRRNGCVDPRLILTTPESGDATCQRVTISEQQLRQQACARQQQLMSALEPGQINCSTSVRPPDHAGRPSICGNPAVDPTEEAWSRQCGPQVTLPGPHVTSPPSFYGNAGVSILDGTGLRGLDLPKPSKYP
ncbi:MAG: hypothetical protein ACOZJX_05795 [Pseudomonadota bacterium]